MFENTETDYFSEQTGDIAEQDEQEDRADIVAELGRPLAHDALNHAVQLLHYKLDDVLECAGNLSGLGHGDPGCDKESDKHQKNDQDTYMGSSYPDRLAEKLV